MYQDFFQLSELPFSIVPNPKFYYLSERHKEALKHVLRGIEDGGGLALLTGEVGTGKTTTLRQLLERLPKASQVITLLNPSITVLELMTTLCQELGIEYGEADTFKSHYDAISKKLFSNDEKGIKTILLVDEAQHVSPDVLEQLRLLTNIETTHRKLLKVILVGQPELQQMLRQPSLRQLAQRITGRYHLIPLPINDVRNYIVHRLNCAGRLEPLFSASAANLIAIETSGVPRLINLVCDQALKIAFRESKQRVSRRIALTACRDVLDWQGRMQVSTRRNYVLSAFIGGALVIVFAAAARISLAFWQGNETRFSQIPFFSAIIDEISAPKKKDETRSLIAAENTESMSIARLIQAGSSSNLAIQNLYKYWGLETDILLANCLPEVRSDLACHNIKTSLSALLALRRPAVLKFNAPDQQSWFAILLGGGDGALELQVGDKRVLLSEAMVEQIWSDDVSILWRPPFGNPSPITMGQYGERVSWINDRLDEALGAEKSSFNQFGLKLRKKVQEFQRRNGLNADGIPGVMTFMMLDSTQLMSPPIFYDSITVSPAQQLVMAAGDAVLLSDEIVYENAMQPLISSVATPRVIKPHISKANVSKINASKINVSKINIAKTNAIKVRSSAGKGNVADEEFVYRRDENVMEGENKEAFTISDLDLSQLSPELAKKVTAAFQPEKPNEAVNSLDFLTLSRANTAVPIAELSAEVLARIPALNFQMHIYASNSRSRWVRVNGEDVKENGFLAKGVRLKGIEPQQVVVEFEDDLIVIPALSTW